MSGNRSARRALVVLALTVVAAVGSLSTVATADSVARNGVNCRALGGPLEMASNLCICEPCHLCEFSFFKGGCGLIKNEGMSLSDGSEVEVEQPITDPEQWFLTQDEITKSRGGVARDDLSDYSSGNRLQAFVATKEFFDAVYQDLEATGPNDLILLSGWTTDEVPLKPETDPIDSTFQTAISRAVVRGANFHALIWSNLLERDQNLRMRDFINGLQASSNGSKAEFIFDDRLSAAGSAHHQKTVVIIRDGQVLVAYLGGVDWTSDRWDTIMHDQASFRKKTGITNAYDGWLDAHVRIEGPAADDVAVNFLARWNSKTKPAQDLLDDMLDFENPEYSALPPLPSDDSVEAASDSVDSDDSESDGQYNVQIVRTFSCKYSKYEFAPKGEASLFHARIKAIRNAKNYIYIEDQYFLLVPELLDELLKVLPNLQRVIVVVPRQSAGVKLAGYEKYMFDMVSPIQKLFPNKFQLYTTKESRNLYIHTKLVIVDDVYLSIGSANWNRRSMTSDSEIGANVVDDEAVKTADGITVNKLALDYRLRKFVELTGEDYGKLEKMKFIDAANHFDVAAKDASTIVESLELDEKPYFAAFASDSIRGLVDALETC